MCSLKRALDIPDVPHGWQAEHVDAMALHEPTTTYARELRTALNFELSFRLNKRSVTVTFHKQRSVRVYVGRDLN